MSECSDASLVERGCCTLCFLGNMFSIEKRVQKESVVKEELFILPVILVLTCLAEILQR